MKDSKRIAVAAKKTVAIQRRLPGLLVISHQPQGPSQRLNVKIRKRKAKLAKMTCTRGGVD
jgi:hypothetical protein